MGYLGDYSMTIRSFPNLDSVLEEFRNPSFSLLPLQDRLQKVCKALLDQIAEGKEGEFLLIQTLDFMEKIHQENILPHFHFTHFELWLNQFSNLSFEQNLKIRGKIGGRFVPRESYQTLFPIGMGRVYEGSHFVTAHKSPDLDTTVASFWGWVDAFSARVSQGLHVWNVPGGKPPDQVEIAMLFPTIFGPNVFELLAKHRTSLSVSGMELVTQDGVMHKSLQDSALNIDPIQKLKAVILINEKGHYLGEWRSTDVDRVRTVVNLLNQCLRWYQNTLHIKLITLFAKDNLLLQQLQQFFKEMQAITIEESEPAQEFSLSQKEAVHQYLMRVLNASLGVKSSFYQLLQLDGFFQICMQFENVFDKKGNMTTDRTKPFQYLAHVVVMLEQAIYELRSYVDQLRIALKIKSDVLDLPPNYVHYRADLEEIRNKMDHYPYVTVVGSDHHDSLFPLGVIHSTDLFKATLGTVSLRDFSNREETKIPPYLEVISILDHHKSQIITTGPSVSWLTDAQSSNTLVAQLSFAISDLYSTGGLTPEEIAEQVQTVQKDLGSPTNKRILQRLLQKQIVSQKNSPYFVAPEREQVEYLHCLYAILDDTDLLSKVSVQDVECVAQILNRLKSLSCRLEMEVIHFDDLPRDATFLRSAATRILQNDEMYSLYKRVYLTKEKNVEENLQLAIQGKPSAFFADTKEQNGCCRVGQTKLFSKNFPSFIQHSYALYEKWAMLAEKVYHDNPEIDLHLHMISTIAGAEEIHSGKPHLNAHHDELWFWIPKTEMGSEHLKTFLQKFGQSLQPSLLDMKLEYSGSHATELQEVFQENFPPIPLITIERKNPIAILKYTAGTLNSRKAAISPYLPIP